MSLVTRTYGETQEKAINEQYKKIKVLEDGIKDLFPDGTQFDGKNVGLLDILLCSTFCPYKVLEEVLGLKVIDPEKNPLIFSWVTVLIEVPMVKELMPSHEKPVEVFRIFRNYALNPPAV
ncbi:Glutathione S-transferase, C-terminal-like [Parasponia andersonii]|uniref:Glutathione S-transferase, C-terminal-like n=1 Tax=Parasponia andersonii TaxID=3476 RepID=A0A2P5C8P5_PARAD|nr:Glutathione S-transferase, C-terminal-like [Parasponia andersonii]